MRLTLALALMALLLVVCLSDGASSDYCNVVQASEILAEIERGEPVKYDEVVVEGDLNLSELDLPIKHVERTESEICLKYEHLTKISFSSSPCYQNNP